MSHSMITIIRKFPVMSLLSVLVLPVVAGCSQYMSGDIHPSKRQLTEATRSLLFKKGMREESPILIRIFKQESELEIWKAKDDGRFYHFRTYPICAWSGKLGPKLKQGDRQAPEGFYTVSRRQLNPFSKYHLSFNLGYPNRYDRAHGRTGNHLMVHGDCRSAGCYAMTDAVIEEIYALVREALEGGQKRFQVQAFPFRMTAKNMRKHRGNRWYGFWRQLKVGYDQFERTRRLPKIDVCDGRYVVNAVFTQPVGRLDPVAPCPPFYRMGPSRPGARDLIARQQRQTRPDQSTTQQTGPVQAKRAAPADDNLTFRPTRVPSADSSRYFGFQ